MYDEETSLHEAGHAVAADALGCKVSLVTAEPGEHWAGMCRFAPQLVRDAIPDTGAPLLVWEAGWQRHLAAHVSVLLAGEMAAEMFAARPATGAVRLPESVTTQAGALLEELCETAPEATAAEREQASADVNEPGQTDAERVAHLAWVAHGGDVLRAASWLRWVEEETRALLLGHERAVRRMAGLLMLRGTLGEEAAAACLRPEGASR